MQNTDFAPDKRPRFSILDLSPITQGSTARQALVNSLDLARHDWREVQARLQLAIAV